MGLKDDWERVVLALHEEGLTRKEIAEQVPISSAYVSQIVAEAGRTFPGSARVAPATRGRDTKAFERRLAQAERLTEMMGRSLGRGDHGAAAGLGAAINKLVGPELSIAIAVAIEEERAIASEQG